MILTRPLLDTRQPHAVEHASVGEGAESGEALISLISIDLLLEHKISFKNCESVVRLVPVQVVCNFAGQYARGMGR